MGFKKRQLVLAALVVSLGAAVYLNWQFSGTNDIIATGTSQSDKELGETQLVNGSGSSLTSRSPEKMSSASSSTSSKISSAVSSSMSTVSTSTSAASSAATSKTESSASSAVSSETSASAITEYFNQARLSRQKTRDEAIELLEKVMNDKTSTEAAKKKAVDDAAVIAQNMLKESNIENLIKSKGYIDCVVFLQNDECNVVVKKENQFVESDAVAIRDIITGQTEVKPSNIKIVEAK